VPHPLFEARVRAQRHWYRDGLAEIPLGIVQLLMGGANLIAALGNRTSPWFVPVNLTYAVLFVVLAVFAPRIMAAVRERITYPRSGYVDYGESVRKRRIWVGMVLAFLASVIGVPALRYAARAGWDPAHWLQWSPAVLGLTTGAVGVYVTMRYGLPRFLVVGVLAIILGVVVSIEYPPRLAMAIWLAGVGCAWLCSGGLTLRNYLRTAPSFADDP
jgi:uncharacterized membrane protein HdeD (DUF308 family)